MKIEIAVTACGKNYLSIKLPRGSPETYKTAFTQAKYCVPHLKAPSGLLLCSGKAYQNWLEQLGNIPRPIRRMLGTMAGTVRHCGQYSILMPARFARMLPGKATLTLGEDETLLLDLCSPNSPKSHNDKVKENHNEKDQ